MRMKFYDCPYRQNNQGGGGEIMQEWKYSLFLKFFAA